MRKRKASELHRYVVRCWNAFDPIGVVTDAEHDDEYLSYVTSTVTLIARGADAVKVAAHIERCVRIDMGLSDYPINKIRAFAHQLIQFHEGDFGS